MLTILERNEHESARDYAYRVIRYNILELFLAPGTSVSEKILCDQLLISRTPVREALIDLSRQRLVDIVPQKGTIVSLIDPKMVEEGHFLRALVEKEVVQQVCNLIDERTYRLLESNIIMQEYHAKHNALNEFIHLDNEFHKTLFLICDKLATFWIVADFQAHFDRERKLSLQYVSVTELVEDHRKVLEAIKSGNAIAASEQMGKHLAHVLIDQQLLIARFPEYFVIK
jgi:GntR family transcriptional regulator, rspAB operon transcriptional repressor